MFRTRRKRYPTERLGALSDGVFAIALTLLVLELKLPADARPTTLASMIEENGHELIGWVVSFIILARFWAIHHDAIAEMRRVTSSTIFMNFVFLGTISLIPFAAHLVGEYELSEPLVMQIFSVLLALNALSLGGFIWMAERDNQLNSAEKRAWSIRAVHHLAFVPLLAVACVIIAIWNPGIALALWGLEALIVIIALSFTWGDSADEDAPQPISYE
jgi:uncharacterized membrane protein